jgi:hypothetical protein
MQLRKHKTAMPAVATDTSLPTLGGMGGNDVGAGESVNSIPPSPAPAPEMLMLKQRLEESERARQLANNQLAEMQAAQLRQQQEISPQKQRFLNQHPEAHKQMDRLGQLHRAAIIAGLPDNSDEYFSYLERALTEPPATTADRQVTEKPAPPIEPEIAPPAPEPSPPPEPVRNYAVSAPVHREAVSLDGRSASYSKIELTREQVEHAKLAGVGLEDYARGVQRLEREKRAGVRQA